MGAWIRGNGSYGCLYDSCEVYETKEDAIEAAQAIFDDIPEAEWQEMTIDLEDHGFHSFLQDYSANNVGADYVEVLWSKNGKVE
jgi:hypothetical protein